MPTVSCPSCGRALEVDDAYRDWTVRCPHCATELDPSEVPATAILMSVFSGLAVLPYTIVMVVGGRKMRSLSSYGWAMTASVVGIASIVLFCSVCVCALVPIGFGIWGVVTLNNPIVSRAFAR